MGEHIDEVLKIALVGPLPAEVQNYTTYSGALSADTAVLDAATLLRKEDAIRWVIGELLVAFGNAAYSVYPTFES